MSSKQVIPPPFTDDEDEVEMTTPLARGSVVKRPSTTPLLPKDPKRGHSGKDPPPHSTGPSPAMGPSPSAVGSTIARFVHQFITDAELQSWSKCGLEENHIATTKSLCEGYIRQVSHHREMRAVLQAREKEEKDAAGWNFKYDQSERERGKLVEAHKKELGSQVEKTRDARKKIADLEKKASELGASQVELENSLAAAALKEKELLARVAILEAGPSLSAEEKTRIEKENLALGQVKFMKSFMKKLPDFDWGLLGEATKTYATGLAKEMEEEAQQKAVAIEARRAAEEAEAQAKIANEAQGS